MIFAFSSDRVSGPPPAPRLCPVDLNASFFNACLRSKKGEEKNAGSRGSGPGIRKSRGPTKSGLGDRRPERSEPPASLWAWVFCCRAVHLGSSKGGSKTEEASRLCCPNAGPGSGCPRSSRAVPKLLSRGGTRSGLGMRIRGPH